MHITMCLLVGTAVRRDAADASHPSIVLGGIIGPLLWTGLLYHILGFVNPLLDQQINWIWFAASQVAFGVVAGLVVVRQNKVWTTENLPLAMRAGIEAPGIMHERDGEDTRAMKGVLRTWWHHVGRRCWCCAGCTPARQARPGPEVPRPDSVLDPVVLYRENCAGCHGAEGKHGAAMSLADPVYLAIVDDDTLRATISKGRPGTAMSAFAQKEGGMLTDQQIDAIIHGIRQRWSKPNVLTGVAAPPYAAKTPGNPTAWAVRLRQPFAPHVMATGDKGGPKAGSVTNGAYLSLISDQGLRTIVITGRPDFDAPDWRSNVPGHPMTDQEISDVVAWLASQRPASAGLP